MSSSFSSFPSSRLERQHLGARCLRSVALLLFGASVLLQAACGDPIKESQKIEEARVLAVRVEDAEGHSTVSAGETVVLSLLVAGPAGPVALRSSLELCPAIESSRGVPVCATEERQRAELPAATEPRFELEVPDTWEPGRTAVRLALCESGTPSLAEDPLDWSCSDGSRVLRASWDFELTEPGEEEEHPNLAGLSVQLDDAEASLEDVSLEPACEQVPSVAVGSRVPVRLAFAEGVREADEVLQVSHFSTRGTFERPTSIVDPEEESAVELEFEAGASPGPLKQYVVVRDGRGGVSFASWSVCIVSEE